MVTACRSSTAVRANGGLPLVSKITNLFHRLIINGRPKFPESMSNPQPGGRTGDELPRLLASILASLR